jgi:hypothetical protein
MELMGIAANAMVSRYAHARAQRLIEAVPMLDGESWRDMQPASTTARPSRYIHQIICDTSRPSHESRGGEAGTRLSGTVIAGELTAS